MSLTEGAVAPVPTLAAAACQNSSDTPLFRRERLAGLLIVFFVSIFPLIMWSIVALMRMNEAPSNASLNYRFLNGLLNEVTSLALLLYVIRQNRQSLADFGLIFRLSDIPFGILLWAAALCLNSLTSPTIFSVSEMLGWHHTTPNFRIPSSALLAYLYAFLSPIFEEMIVRAFFMTEILALTRNSGLAILLSVLVQTSYHLYQGIPYALSAAVMFLMLSIFYARTTRIVPVILAHIIWDCYVVFFHLLRAQT